MATFVMVHGAYQGGWIWKPVATRLRAQGHVAYAPTLDGCAEKRHQVRPGITVATHAQEIADFLFYEDLREVVLAGTSSGGMVILKAAELARDRIARLSLSMRSRWFRASAWARSRTARRRERSAISRPGLRARTPRTACSKISTRPCAPGRSTESRRIRSQRSRRRWCRRPSGIRSGRRR